MGPVVYVWGLSDIWGLETTHGTVGHIWSLNAVYDTCQDCILVQN